MFLARFFSRTLVEKALQKELSWNGRSLAFLGLIGEVESPSVGGGS